MNKILPILAQSLPILLMIILIPIIKNDIVLAVIDIAIIVIALRIRYTQKDILFLVFGFCIMTLSEYFFISTGVEVFERKSLLGVMPLWLPILWSYGFVAMRRAIMILEDR